MEAHHFDTVARLLGHALARRRFLTGLAMSPLAGLISTRFADDTEAKKKRKKRKKSKKPKPNAYGCLNVGQPCNGDSSQCCSGRCEGVKPKRGKKDTSVCVGHDDAGICFPDSDTCSVGSRVLCNFENTSCACVLTTGNAGFCGDFTGEVHCRECSRDVDCQEEFGSGAACVVLKGACSANCPDTGRTACVPACQDIGV